MTHYDLSKILSETPVRVTWDQGAKLISRYEFPVAPRTLRTWGLKPTYPNGKATLDTAELMAEAR